MSEVANSEDTTGVNNLESVNMNSEANETQTITKKKKKVLKKSAKKKKLAEVAVEDEEDEDDEEDDESGKRKPSKPRSWTWDHFTKVIGSKSKTPRAQCN